MLDLRSNDPANSGVDWARVSSRWDACGVVYGVYHFAAGRWYVGQTVRTIHQRAYDHWTARFRAADLFHQALALDTDPFGFIAVPLEFIPRERYHKKGMQRKVEVAKFREVATPRERYWVGRVNSMWPHGWNSMVPGKPVSSSYQRRLLVVPSSQGQQALADPTGLPDSLDPA